MQISSLTNIFIVFLFLILNFYAYGDSMINNPIKKFKNILIICAMDVEENAILGDSKYKFKEHVIEKKLGIKYKIAKFIEGQSLLVSQSGVGSINASLNIAFIYKNHPIDAVILLGVAGSLRSELKIGDVVIAKDIIKHDSIYSGLNKRELMAPGELFLSIKPEDRISPLMTTDQNISSWIVDELKILSVNNYYYGTLMSGDEFVGNKDRKLEIAQLDKNSYAVEMEAAGIAMICKKLSIPFIAIKTIVDRLNPEEGISNDYTTFLKKASDNTKIIFNIIVKSWEKNEKTIHDNGIHHISSI